MSPLDGGLADAGAEAVALDATAAALGLALDTEARERLVAYLALLRRWNATYNLTAVRDLQQMRVQHLADAMAAVGPLRRVAGATASVLDVGSGGGLPGVVLAVLDPTRPVTCIDTVGKKAAFVRQVAGELGMPNLRSVHGRVETMRERFDVVASRAFASLSDFVAWSRGCLAPDGRWMAMKGRVPEDEMASLPPDVSVFHVERLQVPELDAERCIVWMKLARPRG
jgi:16S rRNA (guanine527-N7)-methyltransferase